MQVWMVVCFYYMFTMTPPLLLTLLIPMFNVRLHQDLRYLNSFIWPEGSNPPFSSRVLWPHRHHKLHKDAILRCQYWRLLEILLGLWPVNRIGDRAQPKQRPTAHWHPAKNIDTALTLVNFVILWFYTNWHRLKRPIFQIWHVCTRGRVSKILRKKNYESWWCCFPA